MNQYGIHHEKFQMQIDAALLRAAQDVARSLLETDIDVAPVVIGADDNRATFVVSRTKHGVVPMHTFELEGTTFYIGFPPQPAE